MWKGFVPLVYPALKDMLKVSTISISFISHCIFYGVFKVFNLKLLKV
jgi:hypothetical protein